MIKDEASARKVAEAQKRGLCEPFGPHDGADEDCVIKIKSPDLIVQNLAKQKLAALQRSLLPEQRDMIQENLQLMEKRSRRMNLLASKSKDRRTDWIKHTLDVLANDISDGGKRELEQAKTIVNGKEI